MRSPERDEKKSMEPAIAIVLTNIATIDQYSDNPKADKKAHWPSVIPMSKLHPHMKIRKTTAKNISHHILISFVKSGCSPSMTV